MWFHSEQCSYADILLQVIWSHLARTTYIIPFWSMLVGRHTCTSDLSTLARNLMHRPILTYDFRRTYLYKWFDHTLLKHKCIIPFLPTLLCRHTCTSDLIPPGRNLIYYSFLTYALRLTYLQKFTLGRKLMNHSNLANAVSQTYLYKWFDQFNESFHFD